MDKNKLRVHFLKRKLFKAWLFPGAQNSETAMAKTTIFPVSDKRAWSFVRMYLQFFGSFSTSNILLGLSSPGKCHHKMSGRSRISRTHTDSPVY